MEELKQANNIETNFDGVDFLDENGNVIDDMKQYMEEHKNVVTCNDIIEIGTIVKRKKIEQLVSVEMLNVETPIGKFDFAGKKVDDDDPDLVLFNRKDVESIVNSKINETVGKIK